MHQAEQDRPAAQRPLQEATSKVEEIISHAETAAGSILDGAEVEAERYVREVCQESEREAIEHARALAELSDNLIAQAEALSRQSSLILEHLNALGEEGNGALSEEGNGASPERLEEPSPVATWREQEPYGPAWGEAEQQVGPVGVEPPLDITEGPAPGFAEEPSTDQEPSSHSGVEPPPDFAEGPPPEIAEMPPRGWRQGPRPVESEPPVSPFDSGEVTAIDSGEPVTPFDTGEGGSPFDSGEPPPAGAPAFPFEPEVVRSEEPINERYSPGARLLATQMAVAGSDRVEIRDRLVNDFEIGDPDPLLDAIIGGS